MLSPGTALKAPQMAAVGLTVVQTAEAEQAPWCVTLRKLQCPLLQNTKWHRLSLKNGSDCPSTLPDSCPSTPKRPSPDRPLLALISQKKLWASQ